MSIPVGLNEIVARLNTKFLPAKRQRLYQDSIGFYLVNLDKSKCMTPAQVEALANELGALQGETINFG